MPSLLLALDSFCSPPHRPAKWVVLPHHRHLSLSISKHSSPHHLIDRSPTKGWKHLCLYQIFGINESPGREYRTNCPERVSSVLTSQTVRHEIPWRRVSRQNFQDIINVMLRAAANVEYALFNRIHYGFLKTFLQPFKEHLYLAENTYNKKQ